MKNMTYTTTGSHAGIFRALSNMGGVLFCFKSSQKALEMGFFKSVVTTGTLKRDLSYEKKNPLQFGFLSFLHLKRHLPVDADPLGAVGNFWLFVPNSPVDGNGFGLLRFSRRIVNSHAPQFRMMKFEQLLGRENFRYFRLGAGEPTTNGSGQMTGIEQVSCFFLCV